MNSEDICRGKRLQVGYYEWDLPTIDREVLDRVLEKFINKDNDRTIKFSNESVIYYSSSKNDCRGNKSNEIWHPFINEDGNGCCMNILTGDTYLDYNKEELI